jgi:microcystin degradation protein MlrC
VPRVLVAECKQEVSSFNPVPSQYADFAVLRGEELLGYHRRVADEMGGALSVFDGSPGVEVIPTFSARAITSGGPLAASSWQRLAREWSAALAEAPPCDGVYLSLHGAMCAEGEDDPEGYLLQEARRILGEAVPIALSLDLHGILTDRMLCHADAVVVYHTYPHVDFHSTGQRAARLLLRLMAGEVVPVTAKVEVPVLARGDELITRTGSVRHVIEAAQAVEREPWGLSAGMFWGNPFTDVRALRSNSLVVADGDEERARQEALRLADLFWQHHEKMRVPLTSLAEAARQTCAHHDSGKGGTVALVDAADATSSGASGDSNAVVRALLETGYQGTVLAPVVDALAVQAAFAAGVGKTLRVPVGGALDPRRFAPLGLEARVHLLSEGLFRSETTRSLWNAGPTAVLKAGNITLVATSRPVSLYDRALFWAHGQEPRHFGAVVVKSPHCEPQMFKEWAALYLDVDAPGATSADVKSLGHTQCPRPIWPLDEGVGFKPVAKIFRRNKQ